MRLACSLRPNQSPARRSLVRAAVFGTLGLVVAGCHTGMNPQKGFLDPTELAGRTSGRTNEPLVVPILDAIEPALETPDQRFVNAAEPRADDLEFVPQDYRISPNDFVRIAVTDLLPGVETTKDVRVSQTGNISMPYLKQLIPAAGKTEQELERAVSDAYREENVVKDAPVTVTVIEARGRTFSILGAVARQDQYAILDTNFRMTDALVRAGGVTSQYADTAYVIRRLDNGQGAGADGAGAAEPRRTTTSPAADDLAPPGGAPPAPGGTGTEADVVIPDEPSGRVTTIDGQQVTVQPTDNTAPAAGGSGTQDGMARELGGAGAAGGARPSEPFAFNAPTEPTNVRVIRIPLDRLRAGELKYNIPVLPGDTIVVPEPEIGVYYVGGHVAAPGVFTLAGEKVTLMDAIIAARMLDSVAVPQRTDIVRRLGPDRQVFIRVDLAKIFEGLQPDLYIKPNDKVMVGTNFLAPFLAAARGAFRLTYGLGFIYDRNFAVDEERQTI